MDERLERIHNAAAFLKEKLQGRVPIAGIILGSGLGSVADMIDAQLVIPYKDIPGYPVSTAIGHKGNFIFGTLGGKFVMAMQGRFHYYEGYHMDLVTLSIRVMKVLGAQYVLVSNAAGAANPAFHVGDMVIIKDHINTMPNPLIGPNLDEFGPRFPDMTCAYDMELRNRVKAIAAELGYKIHEGVYFGSTGPTYETPAEVRFYRSVGADMLGMSTVPEVIVARHCGLRVFGMSVITNVANTDTVAKVLNDGADVVFQADQATARVSRIFIELIKTL